jgi:DNA-binding transcriptional MerR regulator
LTPPSRSEGRAEYEQDHVDQIVAIKQAQQDGISLEQLIEQQETKSPLDTTRFTLNANFMTTYAREIPNSDFALRSESRDEGIIEASAKQDEFIGWSVHFESVVLSGYGTAPTREQIDAIRRILEL